MTGSRSGPFQGNAGGSRPPAPPLPSARLTPAEVGRIFAPDGYLAVNDLGQRLGNALVDGGATRSQVRNILNSFQIIKETWEAIGGSERGRQIARLKPNLVYLAARETNQGRRELLEGFAHTLGHGIDAVLADGATDGVKERFVTLVDLVEAITAYHRVRTRGE